MSVHGDQGAKQPELNDGGICRVRTAAFQELHLALLVLKNLGGKIGGNPDDARRRFAVGRIEQGHILRAQFIHENPAQKIGVEIFNQHLRLPVGWIAGTPIGEAHEIHKGQRNKKKPHEGALPF